MKNILLIGAGRSASTLIAYLLERSSSEGWNLTVADLSVELAASKTKGHPNALPLAFDIQNESQRKEEVGKADLVISMLPAAMHLPVAKECIRQKKHLVTASYVSAPMRMLDTEAKNAGILMLNETGLDPGIDHMSAMKVIDELKAGGNDLITFKSYCGGLVAPESNDNPWGYKFTWSPQAVVKAGQTAEGAGATAQFLSEGKTRYIPYSRLFSDIETIRVGSCTALSKGASFDAYANRDSLSYIDLYGLHGIKNMLRGTLRMPGYCKAWNAFVQLGLTDDIARLSGTAEATYAGLIESFLPAGKSGTLKKRLASFLRESETSPVMKKLEWLGIFRKDPIGLPDSTPAGILLDLLMKKWALKPQDKDMVVMQHVFEYRKKGGKGRASKKTSTLVVIGDDQVNTAMSKTVGLPLGIAAKHILNGNIRLKGVRIPTVKEIYDPVLAELEALGIQFIEKAG